MKIVKEFRQVQYAEVPKEFPKVVLEPREKARLQQIHVALMC